MWIVRGMKWMLRKPYTWFRNRLTAPLREQIHVLEKESACQEEKNQLFRQEIDKKMHAMEAESKKQAECLRLLLNKTVKEAEEQYLKRFEDMQVHMGAIARQVMLAKWKVMDLTAQEDASDLLTCRICGYSQQRGRYDTRETDCIFYGGRLVRYVCPKCGVIFGPTKFTDMEQKKIDDDYQVHYLGFSEGDSSYKEEKAFFMLLPAKEGVYLNYGCGHWSNSLENLRKQGYQVFGYEPYSPDVDNPYMITDREMLLKMRFDGIYSNDVLEHLLNPVEELIFMRSLLLNMDSKMAHSTACYLYRYEYTRFHTHFYTGNSVSILCEKSGLRMIDACNEIDKNDFICYVFAPAGQPQDLLKDMKIQGHGERDEEGNVVLHKKSILYGPYLNLAGREYRLDVKVQGTGEAVLKITARCGQKVFHTQNLCEGGNQIVFVFYDLQENVEFVIENRKDTITIESIRLS